jgi:DNA-binding winged helix-turn-helix (wHTH) protein
VAENHHLAGRLRFGVFELDLRAGELRKHGLKVRIQEQPFQVLAMLVEHSGEVVTREDLQRKLWPVDTFVDFDHGLNKAVNKIREALGDSSESPRFVETVSRRGYRFLADVKDVDAMPVRNPTLQFSRIPRRVVELARITEASSPYPNGCGDPHSRGLCPCSRCSC